MMYQPQLTEEERTLVLDLLEHEERELHSEFRRSTASLEAHEDFRKRITMVHGLIERLKTCPQMMQTT